MRRRWFVVSGAAALSALLLVTACSSSKSNLSASAAASGSSGAVSGDPIRIMAMATINSPLATFPEIGDAAVVYEKWTNAHGGLDGRPVKVDVCDTKLDVNASVACARQAASNGDIAATGYIGIGTAEAVGVLAQEGIPWVAGLALAPIEFTSTDSFPVTASGPVNAVALALMAKKYSCKSSAIWTPNLPNVTGRLPDDIKAFEQQGLPAPVPVEFPGTATDISPYVVKLKGFDCVFDAGTATNFPAELPAAMTSTSVNPRRLFQTTSTTPATIKQDPAFWNNRTIIISEIQYPTPGSPWKNYLAAIPLYASYDTTKNDYVGNAAADGTWAASTIVGNIVTGMLKAKTAVTAKSLLAQLDKTTSAESGGLLPPINFTKLSNIPNYPRMFNTSFATSSVENGLIVPDTSYHDVGDAAIGGKSNDPFFQAAG